MIFFTLMATVILENFSSTYEYGFGTEPCMKDNCTSASSTDSFYNPYCLAGGTATACSDCNRSNGYETFLSKCYRLANTNISGTGTASAGVFADSWANATHCLRCTDWGFKTTARGMNLFVIILGMVFIAIVFFALIKYR